MQTGGPHERGRENSLDVSAVTLGSRLGFFCSEAGSNTAAVAALLRRGVNMRSGEQRGCIRLGGAF